MGPIVLAQDVITPEKAATMAQNFRDGGHVKVLAQVLWDWQANGILNKITYCRTLLCVLFSFSLIRFLNQIGPVVIVVLLLIKVTERMVTQTLR